MVDPRLLVVANVLLGYTGECCCHEGYTGRNLIDPECTYHSVPNDEAAADIIAALDGMGQEPEKPAPLWNIFLFDPQRKYGDYMVSLQARTMEEAEAQALLIYPGSSIAHPTTASPYAPVPWSQAWGGMQSVIR